MIEARIPLGPTPVQVSPLGIGAWQWGDRLTWGYGRQYAEADVRLAFHTAVQAGADFFDTAEIYGRGRSEALLGRFMHESGAQPIVATKFMPFPWRLRRADLRRALRASLRRLGVARVDLYQMHWPMPPVPIETWMQAMAEAVDAGWVRAVGVSNYDAQQTRRAHAALVRLGLPLASNQLHYSLLRRERERDGTLAACRDLGVAVIAYSPLEKGILSGKYSPEHPAPGLRSRVYPRSYLARIAPVLDGLRRIGRAYGKTPSQVALNWVICKGAIPIPGVKNARQVEENVGALGWRLTEADLAELDALSDRSVGSG